ncbi:MAG TPA: ATP-binding protein [Rhizobiaceae bacterium]|nr:ATP-binding protein [Rhizobiaceae bacterium]
MSEITTDRRARRWRSVIAERVFRARWTLLASLVAIVTVTISGGAPVWLAGAAIVVVLAAAALAPRRPIAQARIGEGAAGRDAGFGQLAAPELAAAVPDPLIVFDRQGYALFANEAATASFGQLRRGLALRMKFRAPEMQDLLEEVLSDLRPAAIDYAERVPIERIYRVSATPIGHGTGLFVLIFKDQSEARRIDRMRADFIANASHELRTPLASIAGFIETLRGPAKNDANAREQFLKIMQDQTGRMARLIDDLLSLSRLEMKPLLSSGTTVELKQTVNSVIDSLSPLANDSAIEIVREFPNEEIAVPGSYDELFQVFENLLENACKYGQAGGKVVVRIAASSETREATVSFRDFGPGIAEEHIPRITERFYRVDVDTSRAQKGTGLGLSIVKHILTRHGARLSIKSELGDGAEFSVHLPLGRAEVAGKPV